MKKENTKNIGFFRKIILAITDFRFYPLMLKLETTTKCIGYFLKLMLLITLIMAIGFFTTAMDGMSELLVEYESKIPDFKLEDGVLSVETREIYKALNDLIIIVDTDFKYDEIKMTEADKEYQIYDNRVYINSNAITYERELYEENIDGKKEVQIQQMVLDTVSGDYNKETLHAYLIDLIDMPQTKLYIFSVLYIATFMSYIFMKAFEIFLYSIMASLIATISGIKLHYRNYVKIALYVITLPYILEMISMLYLGTISESTFIISNLIAYVYILYAVRAVKLDAFILIMNNPTSVKKGKNGKTIISVDKKEELKEEEQKQEDTESKDDDNKQE